MVRTHSQKFCIKCMRTNACACGTDANILTISDTWKIPSPSERKTRWKNFFKESKNVFRREYLMSKSKTKRELIERNYVFYGLQEEFEGTTVLRSRKENPETDAGSFQAKSHESFEVSIEEDTMARYGSGLFMKLRLEMAVSNDTYETLYLRIEKKEDIEVVKVYNRLVKKVKKITGYEFNLVPVMEEKQETSWRAKKESRMKWVAEFKLPPGLRKLPGLKQLNKKSDRYRYHVGDIDA